MSDDRAEEHADIIDGPWWWSGTHTDEIRAEFETEGDHMEFLIEWEGLAMLIGWGDCGCVIIRLDQYEDGALVAQRCLRLSPEGAREVAEYIDHAADHAEEGQA